jgi:hypothetical protein
VGEEKKRVEGKGRRMRGAWEEGEGVEGDEWKGRRRRRRNKRRMKR